MKSHDAVMVVPGLMGSELRDADGTVLWGGKDPRWYVQAWTSGRSLEALKLTDEERAGKYGRIRASRLLRFPAFAPVVQGVEPYTKLINALRAQTVHKDAVSEFPYDWRLPVAHNAELLAEAAARHLHAWRHHDAQLAACRGASGGRKAQLVIIAHSMGGLLARRLALIPGATDEVKTIVTIATPFYGAPKAAILLSTGRGAPVPLPRSRVRNLAVTLPGVYDVLPSYRCVDVGDTARHLTVDDVVALGGDRDLAEQSFAQRADTDKISSLVGHRLVVGVGQPTIQALTLADGIAVGHQFTCSPTVEGLLRDDEQGDGTVPRRSAQWGNPEAMPLAQTHGAIAQSPETITVVTDPQHGAWLGAGELGLDVPDVAACGNLTFTVTGIDRPRDARCRIVDLASNVQAAAPPLRRRDGQFAATATLTRPGLYRVNVEGGGAPRVSQIVLVTPT